MAKAKRIKSLDCKALASEGIKLVLLTRFHELSGFQEVALDWTDPEGVHSMRVASRRLRSALRDFMPYLRKRPLAPVLKQLRNIADALGEVRDHDVAIEALEKMVAHAPAQLPSGLKPFIETKKNVREQARDELQVILEASELTELESEFGAGVDDATATRSGSPAISFLTMSQEVILERLKEFEALSNGLLNPFEIETLHRMRIAAKRLRYAIELFQQCWGRSMSGYAKRIARIQTALGDLHDCDVWIEGLGKHIINARKHKQQDQLTALMWLLSHLVKLRTRYLRQAFARWREWETHEASEKLRAAVSNRERTSRLGPAWRVVNKNLSSPEHTGVDGEGARPE
ncbi:MAG TPA: CHAD domain-containing protein [Pyrinomonadaceae bacterium]|jgi:CHAD domain-containing protein|nr:CHAD domain-containing protein [Pyrinomonadaceae bacterium]